MYPLRVAMPPHGLIFGANEAYRLTDAFGSVPSPPGPQKRTKNIKIDPKPRNFDFCNFFAPIFPLKDALGFVFSYPTALRASPATVPGFRPPKVGWQGVPANLDGNTSSTSWVGRCDGKFGWEHVPHAPSHPSFTGRVPTQVCYSPFPPS